MTIGHCTISVRHHFSAGHRLVGLPGQGAKCENLHGHTFDVEWIFFAPDNTARQVEFGHVKAVVRGWVDEHLDHGYIVAEDDEACLDACLSLASKHFITGDAPTVETIATVIAEATQELLPGLELWSVRVGEGPSNAAIWQTGL